LLLLIPYLLIASLLPLLLNMPELYPAKVKEVLEEVRGWRERNMNMRCTGLVRQSFIKELKTAFNEAGIDRTADYIDKLLKNHIRSKSKKEWNTKENLKNKLNGKKIECNAKIDLKNKLSGKAKENNAKNNAKNNLKMKLAREKFNRERIKNDPILGKRVQIGKAKAERIAYKKMNTKKAKYGGMSLKEAISKKKLMAYIGTTKLKKSREDLMWLTKRGKHLP